MSVDAAEVSPAPVPAERIGSVGKKETRTARPAWGWITAIVLLLLVCGGGGLFFFAAGQERPAKGEKERHAPTTRATIKVQVVTPVRGGMERITKQPGTIRAFEFANLYSKASGFIQTLNVDRGSAVKNGQLLARIYDPERDVAVLQGEASLEHARASVAQAHARIRTADAAVLAALANQKTARATYDEKVAQRDYRKKEFDRISDLVVRGSAEERLKDEQLDAYHQSLAAVLAAQSGIETAAAQLAEARAKVEQAKADLKVAEAQVQVADANLKLAKVLVAYTRIESPYDGVVIFRGEAVHRGSFVRAATEGTGEPLLRVAYTKRMRTIVPIPDNQVPYCDVGDPATVTLDALGGRVFKGEVSRTAESEDLRDRTMRVEVDLDNPDGILRDGMFGRVTILLEQLITTLTVPSSCLIDRNGKGEGAVLVVKNGEVHRVDVHVGMDTALRAEIVAGLTENDQIILQPDASIAEGTKVQVERVSVPPSHAALTNET
jgi:RND family efflux transporter MFP subunit